VSRPSHENHVEIEFLYKAIQVDIGEGQPWARAPMSKQRFLMCSGFSRSFNNGLA
jgi:hypothetical protein